MRNNWLRKTIFPVIILLLVITMVMSSFQPVVTQAATNGETKTNGETTGETTEKTSEETGTKTKFDPKATLNNLQSLRRQKILQEVERWEKEQKQIKDRNKKALKGLENSLTIANKAVPDVISIVKDVKNGDEFDTAACVSSVVDLTSGVLACIVPWGTVASVGLKFAHTIATAILGGEEGPDAQTLMEDRLNQRIDEIADQISEVQDQLSELSDEINESTEKIIASVSTAIEVDSDKDYLREFMQSSGKGDFSYNQLRNYIYGKTTGNSNGVTAYYGQLLDAQLHGGTSDEIKHYYDLLYVSLMDNREQFHGYICGVDTGKSIVAAYYNVLSACPDLTAEMGESAEMAAIKFAYDLYQTEMMMDQLILACNNYQYTYMVANELNAYDLSKYGYTGGEVQKSSILDEKQEYEIADTLMFGVDKLRMQFAEDLAYILDVTGSYVVEYNGKYYYHETSTVDGMTYAYVLEGQKVYLNSIPAELCARFDLRADAFDYSVKDLQHEDGIVAVTGDNKNRTVSLKYTDTDGTTISLGGIKFVDASNEDFSGGNGTAEFPYLISTAEQFKNIADGMDKHYCLVKNIDFKEEEILPLGYGFNNVDAEKYEEFTGTLDGNGYTISNLKISGKTNSGIFGMIGNEGVVKNLTLSGVTVDATLGDPSRSENSIVTFTGGIIAGVNNGAIESCEISGCVLAVESSTTNQGAERSVFLKYGGVTGANNGSISAVIVTGETKVDVSSTHEFGGGDTDANENNVFVGGICGTCAGTLEYVGVDKDVVLNAFAKSVLNPNNTVKPHLKAYAGGITTDEGLNIEKVSNIFSLAATEKVTADRKIEHDDSRYPKSYDNAKKDANPWIIGFSKEELQKNTTTVDAVRSAFYATKVYDVEITDKTEKYQVGDTELKQENLEILINGQKVEMDGENNQILNLYGFSTYNKSFEEEANRDVTMLLLAQIDESSVLLTGNFSVKIDKNYVKEFEVYNYDTHYFKGETVETTAFVEYTDANGEESSVTNAEITVKDADTATAAIGKKILELGFRGATCQVEIEVLCNVHFSYFDYENTEHYTKGDSVSATCQRGGYDAYVCVCGETIKTNRTGTVNHDIKQEVSKEPTCETPGEIGKVYCTFEDCNIGTFEDKVAIPPIGHTIEPKSGDANNHRCRVCEENYAHEYVVTESVVDEKLTYTYTCSVKDCGYIHVEQDSNIVTFEELKRPTVVVSDGYALNGGDLVTVYVDLKNNPGVTGANFGIRYDDRLVLVECYDGDFFLGSQVAPSAPVSGGYNFAWGNSETRKAEEGNILKLIFRVPTDATKADRYAVSLVYTVVTGSEGGFSLSDDLYTEQGIDRGYPQKFITKDGVIRLVDRLPGDVVEDGTVNLLDALYLSNCLVNKEEYPITAEIGRYGNVDLVAGVVVNDVVKLLQAINGGHGASLLSPDYEIKLNTNGYAEYQPEPLFVQLYGENNTYAALAEIEEQMRQREGYQFLGWYPRLEGEQAKKIGKETDNGEWSYDVKVSYDQFQKVQTLYARWKKNSVSFDMNGAPGQIETQTYLGSGEQYFTLPKPVEEYEITFMESPYYADPNNKVEPKGSTMSREFNYWLGSDGEPYYADDPFPVHKADLGEFTLTAQWSEWKLDFPEMEKKGYIADSVVWHTVDYAGKPLEGDIYKSIKELQNKVLYGRWMTPITYYVHYDGNGATSGEVTDSVHTYDVSKQLNDNKNGFERQYTVTFDYGWSGQSNSTQTVTYGFGGWSKTKNGEPITDMLANNLVAENNGTVTVYACWIPEKSTLTLQPYTKRPGYAFGGWYTSPEYKVEQYVGDVGKEWSVSSLDGDITLYAKWTGNPYTIVYDGNKPSEASHNVTDVPAAVSTQYGEGVILAEAPTLTGWTFVGWYDEAGNKIGVAGQTLETADLPVSSGITLYAKWQANTVKVNYYANGGINSMNSDTFWEDPVICDTEYTVLSNITDRFAFSRNGYAFCGWSTNPEAVLPEIRPGETYKIQTGYKLYAVWTLTKGSWNNGLSDTNNVVVGNDGYDCFLQTNLNREALRAADYTHVSIAGTIRGRRLWNNQGNLGTKKIGWYLEIYDRYGTPPVVSDEIGRFDYEFETRQIQYTVSIDCIRDDGTVRFRFDHMGGDNDKGQYRIGLIEIVSTGVR